VRVAWYCRSATSKPGIDDLKALDLEVRFIASDQPQVMMERCSRKQAIDCGQRAFGSGLQTSPRVRHGGIDRQQPLSKPSRQLLLEPVAKLLLPFAHRQLFDTAV
jgi:hypothetical protein